MKLVTPTFDAYIENNFCIFLMDYFLYWYAVTFFISSDKFWIKIYFVDKGITSPIVLGFLKRDASCKKETVASFFKIQSAILYILIGELRPFTFRIVTEMYSTNSCIFFCFFS
jgi:hypothetical protein